MNTTWNVALVKLLGSTGRARWCEYHSGGNDYRCKSLCISNTITVSKHCFLNKFAELINSKNIMSA